MSSRPSTPPPSGPTDWVTRAADQAIRHAGDSLTGDRVITCASGASPSGPVHLGNMREFMTVHFVADELKRRGVPARHLHSWDDYDRFRKVPAGVDPSWSEHIGRPLSAVPDPWECHVSWAEHFKAPLLTAMDELGVEMEQVSQTEQYRAGTYRGEILRAVANRGAIEEILAAHRTKKGSETDDPLARFPYKPYCADCGRDTTTATSFSDDSLELAYVCTFCGYHGRTNLETEDSGKLVWKVDWPMRWAYEQVDFEPGGADHATPGSSYTVGKEIVKLFGYRAPSFLEYGFVGFDGLQKMSSSAGAVPTASDALEILEPSIVRWLYVRRNPKQTFDIDFGPSVVRLYDEWDALSRKADDPSKRDVAVLAQERASATASGRLPTSPVTVPFRVLSSVADVTAGSAELISATVSSLGYPHASVEDLQPRLGKAMNWMQKFVPASDRTTVRSSPAARLGSLSAAETEWLSLLVSRLEDPLDVEPVTALVYGVPKLARGLALGDAPTEEVKADQKAFFALLYDLLVDAERGPRLPTLIVALGLEKVRSLLTPADG
jgi:lysyl-tRNA synthetase class 1